LRFSHRRRLDRVSSLAVRGIRWSSLPTCVIGWPGTKS
jgi:hypothetical protein